MCGGPGPGTPSMRLTLPQTWIRRTTPWREWMPGVNRASLRADAIAGITGALVVLPQGLAYAVIAGLPPAYGLYCAMIPVIVAAMFGSSWHLVSGPTAAISIVVFSAVTPLAAPGSEQYVTFVLTLTLLVGLIQFAIGMSGLGALLNFVSHGVVLGFTAGAGVLIAASQLSYFFGLDLPRGGSLFGNLRQFVIHVRDINLNVLLISLVTLGSALFVRRRWPHLPNLMIAMAVGSAAAWMLNRLLGGAEATGVAILGDLPAVLPPLSAPSIDPDVWARLANAAFVVAVLGLTEALAISRAVALRSGQLIQGNQEAVGQGLANIVGAFVSGYASSGSFTRSGINYTSGARTPLGAVFASGFLVLLLALMSPVLGLLPYASMAAVLMLVARSLIDVDHLRGVMRTRTAETWVLLGTFVATLLLNLEFAILAGVFLSLAIYLDRSSKPDLTPAMPATDEGSYHFVRDPGTPQCPQLRIVFLDGSIFFGAANHLQEAFREIDERHGQRHLLLLCSGVNRIDLTGAEMLANEAERRQRMGGGLYLQYVKEPVMDVLRKGGYDRRIGLHNFFPFGTMSMDTLVPRLNPSICANCKVRAFRQCPPPPRSVASREAARAEDTARMQAPALEAGATAEAAKIPAEAMTPEAAAPKPAALQAGVPVDREMKTVLGLLPEAFDGAGKSDGADPLGQLLAELMRRAAGADLGLQNVGGYRTFLPAGPVLREKLFELLPFDNRVLRLHMDGNALRALFDRLADNRGGYRYAQVSGADYTVADSLALSIRVGGEPLVADRDYTLATLDFLFGGGDGYGEILHLASQVDTLDVVARDLLEEALLRGEQPRPSDFPANVHVED